jgi:CAAX protease family protein
MKHERIRMRELALAAATSVLFVGAALGTRYGLIQLIPGLTGTPRLAWRTFCGLMSSGFVTWLMGIRFGKRSWKEMGWRSGSGTLRRMLRGIGLGAAMATVTIAVIVTVGGAAEHFSSDPRGHLASAVPLAIGLLAAALSEELLYRGYILLRLSDAIGRPAVLVVSALVFGVAHLGNPHATLLAGVNVILAGVWLALGFFSPGGMPLAWGLHFGWNGALVLLFDAPLSGTLFDLPGTVYTPGQHAWLDGGAFGPEGGLVTTLVLVGGTIALFGGRLGRAKQWLS